jgi:metal-dependent amidase/aminoacylase/carboxypeptidase family protein
MERDAAYRYSDVRLMRGLAAFALGTLRAAVVNSEDPLSVGLRLAKGDLERKQSYGTVLVVIGPGGVPDDVNVISLSRWARESGRSEARIEAALKAKGYRLMTSQDFSRFMEELESRVLGEMVALPVATSSLAQESADGVPEQLLPQQEQQQGSS